MSNNDEVLVAVDDAVMTVTINRPKARNAINLAVAQGLAAAMDELDSNNDIRVAILSGAEDTFCAGMDLKAFVTGEIPVIAGKGFAGLVEAPPRKPLIAAVEGYALAGGFELVLACDLVVSSMDAKFGIPEARRGLVAAAGGLMRLPQRIPPGIAMEMALTADMYDAQRVYELGMINRLCAAGDSLAEAKILAAKIAANGPLAVMASKQIINSSIDWKQHEMFKKQSALSNPVFASKDAIEGATAFAEKRAPEWKGE